LIHGWNADAEHVALETVRNAYLKLNSSHLLMADWRDIANMRYSFARGMIASVGKRLCGLLKIFAEEAQIGPERIHIVGHSLGAHIGTHVGRCYKSEISR
jgi:pimeloyl-ACP methyl ester carboxylesterase